MTSKNFPYLAIDRPVVPPPVESGGNFCWTFDAKWKPYIAALLKTLITERTYTSDQARATGEASILLASLITGGECEPGVVSSEDCVAYAPSAPFIDFQPQNPYLNPDFVPDGYLLPPWHLVDHVTDSERLLGLKAGDVISGVGGIPVLTPIIGVGLARFRVSVVGSGTVELHLLTLPLGSIALVVPDDDISKLVDVDLKREVSSLPFETQTEVVIEVSFTTVGAHHIDVTLVPELAVSDEFLSYGGGIRSIVLCGFDEMGSLYKVRQNPVDACILEQTIDGLHWTKVADISLCVKDLVQGNTSIITTVSEGDDMGFRISPDDPCVIQRECSPGEWVNWYDPRGCVPGLVTQPPPDGSIAPQQCKEYDLTVLGNGITKLPVAVDDGYTIEISQVKGGWSKNGTAWYCPNGQTYVLGGCSELGAGTDGANPMPDLRTGRLIASINDIFYDAYNTALTVPPGTSTVDVSFQMNDADLTDNHGSISLHVKVCNKSQPTWSHEFNFADNGEQGWTTVVDVSPVATFVPGTGFHVDNPSAVPGQGQLYIQRVAANAQVTHVEVFAESDTDVSGGGRVVLLTLSGSTVDNVAMPDDTGDQHYDVSASGLCDTVGVVYNCAIAGTHSTISKVIVHGLGLDPY